jgi:hypothetical protein
MIRRLLVPAAFAQGGGAPGHLGTPEQQRACRPDVQRFCREMQNQGDYAIADCLKTNERRSVLLAAELSKPVADKHFRKVRLFEYGKARTM